MAKEQKEYAVSKGILGELTTRFLDLTIRFGSYRGGRPSANNTEPLAVSVGVAFRKEQRQLKTEGDVPEGFDMVAAETVYQRLTGMWNRDEAWTGSNGRKGIANQENGGFGLTALGEILGMQVASAGMMPLIIESGKEMGAQFDGFCTATGKRIKTGDAILYAKIDGVSYTIKQ